MAEEQKQGFFKKLLAAGEAVLDAQIYKTRESLIKSKEPEPEFIFGKAVTKDKNYYVGSQGYEEKTGSIGYEFQRQMAIKSSIVAAIIKTRQNRAASYAQPAGSGADVGFRIVLKNKEDMLNEIKEELFGEEPEVKDSAQSAEERSSDNTKAIYKAEPLNDEDLNELNALDVDAKESAPQLSEKEKERKAKEELDNRISDKLEAIKEFVLNCGELKDRPFETKRWNLNSFIRSIVWDSLVYDQIAVELVPKEAEQLNGRLNLHHFYPVDGSTIRYASPELSRYKDDPGMDTGYDILYPEEQIKALEKRDALKLDSDRLQNGEYKYVQVVKGRIERAFTEDELVVGMRNPVTDIYSNGYSLSELELLAGLVTSHLNTEYYRKAYYQQGFAAKGILHIKANLNRSKLEEIKRHWHHMVKGSRNSFQTPIMSGMEEIQWIPLTQSDGDIQYELWLNYLIRMICAIYQIDPSEIGYGMKDEGGAGMSGDNTKEKMKSSKDKGFIPLMMFIANFINVNIIDKLDPDFKLEWVGLIEENHSEVVERELKEVTYKKTVNEIREEAGLPPIEGADSLLLNPVYFQWYSMFSKEAKQNQQDQMLQQQYQTGAQQGAQEYNLVNAFDGADVQKAPEPIKKSKNPQALRVEYYRLGDS